MSRSIVPTQPIPNQTLSVQLDGQACTIEIFQTAYGLFMNLFVGNSLIVCGVVCENLNRIVRDAYLGFQGDLAFFDTLAAPGADGEDPIYTGLGSQFQLLYFEEQDLPAGEG